MTLCMMQKNNAEERQCVTVKQNLGFPAISKLYLDNAISKWVSAARDDQLPGFHLDSSYTTAQRMLSPWLSMLHNLPFPSHHTHHKLQISE